MIVYLENLKNATKIKLLAPKKWLQQGHTVKDQCTNINVISNNEHKKTKIKTFIITLEKIKYLGINFTIHAYYLYAKN